MNGEAGIGPAEAARIAGRVLGGLVAGLLSGLVLTLAILAFRAAVQSVYLHDFDELVSWIGLPVLVLPIAAVVLSLSEPRTFRGTALGAVVGLVAGAALGAVLGAVLTAEPWWPWSGGILGAGVGLLIGGAGALLRASGRTPPGVAGAVVLAAALGSFAACAPAEPPAPPEEPGAEPPPEEVESVVFLLGDSGEARESHYPVLPGVRMEVERWAGALERDSAVVVAILGDLVYPRGLHPPDHELRERDSLRLVDQISLVSGPTARRRGARAFFLAGNHDWGLRQDWEGAVRVHRLADFLTAWRSETGVAVSLRPEAGTGGPDIVDVGTHLRLLLLDTSWWLLEETAERRREVVDGIAAGMGGAGARTVVIAAHHPFESGGPHGGLLQMGRTLGLRWLLTRAGVMLQDLGSPPYHRLRTALLQVFAETGPPAVFAGGHEHSLQVIRGREPRAPGISLVSGSASKLTDIGAVPGMELGLSAPGYAKLFVRPDGSLHLTVEATEPRFLSCPEEAPERERCMEEGVEAFRTVWSGTP